MMASDFSQARRTLLNYARPLEFALKTVVATSLDIYSSKVAQPGFRPLEVNRASPVRLRRDPDLVLTASQRYRLVEAPNSATGYRISIVKYIYQLTDLTNDGAKRVIAFHWHPFERDSPIPYPHIHLGIGAGTLTYNLTDAHIPSGRILLEDVLELAIAHFGVEPVNRHWRRAIQASRDEFARHATWGTPPTIAPYQP